MSVLNLSLFDLIDTIKLVNWFVLQFYSSQSNKLHTYCASGLS